MPGTDELTFEERYEAGRARRKTSPRSSHAEWNPGADRRDPVELLEEQNAARIDFLVPVRRARMAVSPFAFYRAGAGLMAADLATTPVTGLTAQICGDAHLGNFGLFASPERQLVFDINDFDETLPGPWEWDVKRLAASIVLAAAHNGLDGQVATRLAAGTVRAYRKAMIRFAERYTLDVWYALADERKVIKAANAAERRGAVKGATRKARRRDSLHALERLAEEVDGEYRIRSEPPLLIPFREMRDELPRRNIRKLIDDSFAAYAETVSDDLKWLLARFRPVDAAFKVVGVGSVGTRCMILLLEGRDRHDPLFLQIKEAGRSVLEDYLPPCNYANHGQRVVEGQRLMQTASDIFLGWTEAVTGRDFYWRQLRDWKGKIEIEGADKATLRYYGELCGWTLARAHARSGDPVKIAAYLGNSDSFDKAIASFAARYADTVGKDYRAFVEAIKSGRLEAAEDIA